MLTYLLVIIIINTITTLLIDALIYLYIPIILFRSPAAPVWALVWLTVFVINANSSELKEFQFKHHNNEEMYDVILKIREKCPSITSLYRLSEDSVEGRPLLVIVFSIHPTYHKPSNYIFY